MRYEDWQQSNWSRAHQECDVSALTGTSLEGHLTTLGAYDLGAPESVVLCVGVGTGVWVREAAERYQTVWALDVVEAAGRTVPEVVHFVIDPRQLPSTTFDLAMSLWVAPHMTNHDLETQLREVIRSLKPTGVLALHYKEPLCDEVVIDNREGSDDEWRLASSAGVLRRRAYFTDLVRWAGGKILRIAAENRSQFYQVSEVSAHIGKRES